MLLNPSITQWRHETLFFIPEITPEQIRTQASKIALAVKGEFGIDIELTSPVPSSGNANASRDASVDIKLS
jgi:hypothetical protein